MTIYMVTIEQGDYYKYPVGVGAFSSREKAQACIDDMVESQTRPSYCYDEYDIVEYILDYEEASDG